MSSGVFSIPLIASDTATRSVADRVDVAPIGFVAGPENALLKILPDISAGRPLRFNPVTLFGPSGVGKSHLLLGLARLMVDDFQGRKAVVSTGSDFARSFAQAVELDAVADWRQKLRTTERFFLDDLQDLEDKPAAQLQFIDLLDWFVAAEVPVVVTTRSPPLDWRSILPSLRSRLEGGLTIPIAPPSPKTRQAMLGALCQHARLAPSMDLQQWVNNTPVGFTRIQQAVGASNFYSDSQTRPIRNASLTIAAIAKRVARHFQVRLADLQSPSRRQAFVRPRGIAICLCRQLLASSFDSIGQYFGNRDHSTILHAYHKTIDEAYQDVTMKLLLEKLASNLSSCFETAPESASLVAEKLSTDGT